MSLAEAINAKKKGNLVSAEEILLEEIKTYPDTVDARLELGKIYIKILRFDDAYELFGQVITLDSKNIEGYFLSAQALRGSSRYEDALKHLELAKRHAPGSEALLRLEASILLDQKSHKKENRKMLSRWPILTSEIGDYRFAIENHVASGFEPKFHLSKQSSLLTLGSCFATSLADSLTRNGYNASHLRFSEEVNSTLANLALLEWIADTGDQDHNAYFDSNSSPEKKHYFRESFGSCDVIILTIGVAPCFFATDTGKLILDLGGNDNAWSQNKTLRTTTVQENVAALDAILKTIEKINPSANVVLTVSPVPLKATFEMPSVVQADCLSKSILRVATHEILDSHEEITYWPSYEMIRWLAPYFADLYGADDQRSRHISNQAVDAIVSLFMDRHSEKDGVPK